MENNEIQRLILHFVSKMFQIPYPNSFHLLTFRFLSFPSQEFSLVLTLD